MEEMTIVACCINCKHCHKHKMNDNYSCSKGKWYDKYYNLHLCEYWKPSRSDMRLWLLREENK